MRSFAEQWIEQIAVDANGEVALAVATIDVPEIADADLPRASHLVLIGRCRWRHNP